MPKVSVIIPTYNSAAFLVDAVESVLAQTYRDFEILVIDDGSTDDTEQVMERYKGRVHYLRQRNGGVASARNHGIAMSKGHYIAFLDADDTWFPEKLEKQTKALKSDTSARVCYSAFLSVTSDLKPIGVKRSTRWRTALEDLLLQGNIVGSICTVVAERVLFEDLGGFDSELSQCADWDMWVRLAAHSEFLYIDDPLVTYRQHDSNMSRNAPLLEKDSLRVLEKGFVMAEVPERVREQRRVAFGRNYMVLAGTYFHAGHYRDFLRCAYLAVAMDSGQLKYLLSFPFRVAARVRFSQ